MELALYIFSRIAIFKRGLCISNWGILSCWLFLAKSTWKTPRGVNANCTELRIHIKWPRTSCRMLICIPEGTWTLPSFLHHVLHLSAVLPLVIPSFPSLSPTPLPCSLHSSPPCGSDEVLPNKHSEPALLREPPSRETRWSGQRLPAYFYSRVCPASDVVHQSLQRPIVRHFKKNVVILTVSASARLSLEELLDEIR